MNVSRHSLERFLYEFDQGYEVSYINYNPGQALAESQLILTFERDNERRTFAFSMPCFADLDKNLITSQGIYIATLRAMSVSSARIEVGDIQGGFAYFTARSLRDITPTCN